MRSIAAELQRWRIEFGRAIEDLLGLPGSVRWADQSTGQGRGAENPGRVSVTLKILSPPSSTAVVSNKAHLLPASVRIGVEGVSLAGTERVVVVNGHRISAVAGSNADMAAALATAIDGSREPVAATQDGEGVVVTRDTVGDLRSVLGVPQALMPIEVLETELVEITETPSRADVSLNVYSLDATGLHSAAGVMADLLLALRGREAIESFAQIHTAVGYPTPTRDLSGLEGGEIESRAQVDLPVTMTLRRARLLEGADVIALQNPAQTHAVSAQEA